VNRQIGVRDFKYVAKIWRRAVLSADAGLFVDLSKAIPYLGNGARYEVS